MRRTIVIAAEVFVDGMTAQNAAQIHLVGTICQHGFLSVQRPCEVKNHQRMQLREADLEVKVTVGRHERGFILGSNIQQKQRKAAIIVASILGCGALFYLGGLLGQVFTNYTIWMESGGMWGQTQIAAPDWNPAVCLLNAFSWNGVKAIFLIVVIGAGIVIYGSFGD